MRTLREQIYDIAKRHHLVFGSYDRFMGVFVATVEKLAILMFLSQETESADTIAVRRALALLRTEGVVTLHEPEILS